MKKIAIIPARGGSKRIPQKNIKDFLGKPIIAYVIEAAIKSGIYDEVMVSTDSEGIAKIALEYGAKVPFIRSIENSNDFATTVDVLFEVIEWYKQKQIIFDYATCIYACAPFVNSQILHNSYDIIIKNNCDCVFPVLAYSHPIQRALKLTLDNKAIPFDDVNSNARTQDLERSFHDAGMFYTFNIEKLYKSKSLRTDDTFAIEIDELHAQDIDSEDDWVLAELKYKLFCT
ncbi:pseudaminic acid cytidylyltransferase [Flavobacterium sp. '19STA2R22 D10 B1']|uniref:pseudaminic acid cytidylyltransferase n=1 Tax=Flavobacterium aerium TaxID=3037261 RepID=UPI00278C2375|nr:pseudaminic acid cytidylyltransferase [Flavobacterium sp. '19STA2R22 D10 B1']